MIGCCYMVPGTVMLKDIWKEALEHLLYEFR